MHPMQNPTHPEALLLIRIKRERAKVAMGQIVERYGVIANKPEPGLDVLLDYLSNMVYAIELLLKVLADDWRAPGKSHFGHRVGIMYEEVFKRQHSDANLMMVIERAIVNQKFIYEPADRLMDHIPELEALWDELTTELYQRNWMQDSTVQREVVAPESFVQFLRDNISRFLRAEPYRVPPRIPREHRIQMLEHEVKTLQAELAELQAGQEAPAEASEQLSERLSREYAERIKAAKSCFEFNCQVRNGQFSFGTLYFGKVLPGCLG